MRKIIIFLSVMVLLAAGAFAGRKGYRQWKTQRAVKEAKAAFEKPDYNKGLLWLRRALEGNVNNLEAVRMMGDVAEATQSPAMVFWRQRLLALQPESATNRLMLARAALLQQEYEIARTALEGIKADGKRIPDYYKFSASLAIATGNYTNAEMNLREAISLEPQNMAPVLSLAMIHLNSRDRQIAAAGRESLEKLTTNDTVQLEALRQLVIDAFNHTNFARAASLASDLVQKTNAVFGDWVIQLKVLKSAKSPEFRSTLAARQRQASTNGLQVFDLARWMLTGVGASETLRWLETVPPEIRTNIPVTISVADAYLGTRNWTALHGHTSKQHWGDLEYLRLVYSARALREQNLIAASKTDWTKSFREAQERLDRLVALEQLTAAWNWPVEMEEVLWRIVNRFPAERSAATAVSALTKLLYMTGKTRSLMTLSAQELKRHPNELTLKNNLASIALLLNDEEHKPFELARQVYEKQPRVPAFAATYAYSLHLQKRTRDALGILEQFPPEQLAQPSIAGYYGVILGSTGQRDKARQYLEIAEKAPLLPEEKELFVRAKL